MKAKYIKTSDDRIIIFPASMNHTDFRMFDPVSAGFVSFGVGKDGNPDCTCYGESIGLRLKSDDRDSALAKVQILDRYRY